MAVVLSISSQVVRGHVGNSAAAFALARLGHEVWPLPTVVLAHHPGHDRAAPRQVTAPAMIADTVESFDRRGWLAEIDAVLIGYLASAGQASAIAGALARLRAVRPDALIAVDPVIGDGGSLYVEPAIAAGLRDFVLPLGAIATPNAFELGWLADRPADTIEGAVAAARSLDAGEILITSSPEADAGQAANLLVTSGGVWRAETRRLDHRAHGAGDLLAALYLAHRLGRMPPERSLARAAAGAFRVLAETARAGRDELALAAAQDRLAGDDETVRLARLE